LHYKLYLEAETAISNLGEAEEQQYRHSVARIINIAQNDINNINNRKIKMEWKMTTDIKE
jgi:hypothetical protein